MPAEQDWFLTSSERGNDFTALDRRRPDNSAWRTGNRVETLVHGATYFRRLLEDIRELGPGDRLYFTDRRGDPDQRLDGPGTEVSITPAALAADWACRTSVNVMLCDPAARADPQPGEAATEMATMAATKDLMFMAISPSRAASRQ